MKNDFSLPNLNQLIVPILVDLYSWIKKGLQKISKTGMYEVLAYEITLEILDSKGRHALVKKTEEVRFLQDNIIAFQDQAWGAGKILLNYMCSPGIPVDFYPLGHKTQILISLKEVKNLGDVIKFNIQWEIKNGFLKPVGFWATDVNHSTKSIRVNIIFPRDRPPRKIMTIEMNSQRNANLDMNSLIQLPDNKWQITWVKKIPKVNEHYLIKWVW